MPNEMNSNAPSIPEDSNEWARVVSTLITLTEEEKLKWRSSRPSEAIKSDPDSIIEAVYLTEYKNKRLRLYAEAVKVDDPNPLLNVGFLKRKYPRYERQIILQMGDKSEYGWYTIPDVSEYLLEDLLESVKYRVLGVEGFLDGILEGESETRNKE